MALEDKMDALTDALNRNTIAVQEAKAAGAVPSTDAGTKAPPKGKAKTEAAAPKYSADDVKTKFNEIKGADAAKVPTLKKIISDHGASSLAELLTKPDKFDSAYAALEALEAEGGASADDDL